MRDIEMVPGREHGGTRPGLSWLVRMRTGALFSELLAVLLTHFVLHIHLQLKPMLVLLVLNGLSIVWLYRRVGRSTQRAEHDALLALIIDTVTLFALLYLSGGPSNPFSVLYLVYVTLAAVLLPNALTWLVTVLCITAYGALFIDHVQVPMLEHVHHHAMGHSASRMQTVVEQGMGGFNAHLYGMFIAFALAAVLIAVFVGRVSQSLRLRERELAEQDARTTQLSALTTLSAGAAHELSTPLSTIALVSKEILRALGSQTNTQDAQRLQEDARLIRDEAKRCRSILDQMSLRAGEAVGEAAELVNVKALIDEVIVAIDEAEQQRIHISFTKNAKAANVLAPRKALRMVIRNLVDNALQAQSEDKVELAVEVDAQSVQIVVRDHGAGMSEQVLHRAKEPFFTTKEPGKGMGLGLFLADTLARRLQGVLQIESQTGEGTRVQFVLPRARE